MLVSAFRSAVAPAATSVASEAIGFVVLMALPFGAVSRTLSESFASVADSFVTVLRTWIVAESAITEGVVTNVPHGTMCASPVVMSRTWRLIPAPGYHRDAGCCESSTFTAITFLPACRCGVSSYSKLT